MIMLHVGSRAPSFELLNAGLEMIQLSSFLGKKNVVLYFYPRDGTPGCTLEAINFSDHEDAFEDCDTVVFGVSRDDYFIHEEFRDKHGISLQLLSDAECEVMKKYEVLKDHVANGDGQASVHRSTFVIDKKGMVRHILRDLNPREHVTSVLKIVRQIHGY